MNPLSTVLYVEDDPGSRRIMQMVLGGRMRLPHLHIFSDSDNFVERLRGLEPPPQVIFLDIHVHPINGFEMLQEIRRLPAFAHIPVIALTASVMNEEVQQLRTAGFDGCLAKPIDVDEFPAYLARIYQGELLWHIM